MNKEDIKIFIFAAILIVLIVGGRIYWMQLSSLEKEKNELQQKIDSLETQLNQAITEKNELQEQTDELNKKPEEYIKVISPNGGETLCRNEDFVINWESKGVDIVTLSVVVSEAGSAGNYIIGTVSASSSDTGNPGEGKYVWSAGKTRGVILSEGVNYKIKVAGAGKISRSDASDGYFEILLCKG